MNADDIQLRRRPAVHRYSPKSRILLHTSNCPEIYRVFIYLITKAKGHTGHLHCSKIYTIELSGAATGWEGGKLPPYGWTSKNYVLCVCTAVNVSASGGLRTLDPLYTHTSLPPCYKILAAPLIELECHQHIDGTQRR